MVRTQVICNGSSPNAHYITSNTNKSNFYFAVIQSVRLHPKSTGCGTLPMRLRAGVRHLQKIYRATATFSTLLIILPVCLLSFPLGNLQHWFSPTTQLLQFMQYMSKFTTSVQVRRQSIGNLHML